MLFRYREWRRARQGYSLTFQGRETLTYRDERGSISLNHTLYRDRWRFDLPSWHWWPSKTVVRSEDRSEIRRRIETYLNERPREKLTIEIEWPEDQRWRD